MPLQINPDPQRQRAAQSKDIKNYTLVGNKGWLNIFKWEICALLAVWNGHLFIQTIRGRMGVLTAIVAISLEGMALYCVHNYTRSVGDHKKWLGRFAIILGLFSLAHTVVAIVEHTGYASQNQALMFYSNVLALPIIVILLSWATATLTMKHWSAAVMKELALSKIESLQNRARVLMEQHRLLDAHELTKLKAELFEQETDLKIRLIPIIKQRIGASKELEEMIQEIEDPELRREVRRDVEALTSRPQAASLPAASPAVTTTQRQLSPHARPSIFGQALASNGGGRNGHP
jgi:hypothetical protein